MDKDTIKEAIYMALFCTYLTIAYIIAACII